MQEISLDNDFTMFYVTADSYPMGIRAAHEKLHALLPSSPGRTYIGMSRPENGTVVYRAGTKEEFPGEAARYGCKTLLVRKGNYLSTLVKGFRKNPMLIKQAFDEILAKDNLDPQGYCVEIYSNDADEVQCMVRLAAAE
jgi:hypothetical protein